MCVVSLSSGISFLEVLPLLFSPSPPPPVASLQPFTVQFSAMVQAIRRNFNGVCPEDFATVMRTFLDCCGIVPPATDVNLSEEVCMIDLERCTAGSVCEMWSSEDWPFPGTNSHRCPKEWKAASGPRWTAGD